ncbi:hemolysin, partial [Yersinia pestis PY-46]|jgi:hypothetical protein
MPP